MRSAELYAIVNGCYVYAFSQLQQLRWSVTQWLQSAKNGACSHIIIIISPHLHLCQQPGEIALTSSLREEWEGGGS